MTDRDAVSITWHGHSTVLIDIGGVRVLTDPLLTSRVAHLRRRCAVPRPEPADVVAISHLHMDHLHRPSLRRVVNPDRRLLLPAGAMPLVRGLAVGSADEVRPGDLVEVAGPSGAVSIEAVHAAHSSRRGPHSKLTAAPMGYVVRAGGRAVYFAGDTGPFDAMADLGPLDVALLPIWGWGSSLGDGHLDPASAARATALLGADRVIPIHWGTYSPMRGRSGPPPWLDGPLDAFRRALDDHGLSPRLIALRPGEGVAVP